MRRLAWGLLATFGLLSMVGCGTGGDAPAAPAPAPPEERAVDDTALAASRAPGPDPASPGPPRPVEFTVLLTSSEGVSSPGLDATISALLGRPDLGLAVIAPAADATASVDRRSSSAPVPVRTETMTGHPASAVNGTMADTLDVALAGAAAVDLVVIGATADPDALAIAEVVRDAGLAALVVRVGPEPDLAAAGLALLDVLDFQLDELVGAGEVHVLDVDACVGHATGPSMVTTDVEPNERCAAQAIP
jgi:hypothetical protein